jgi:hypothetical protein
MNDCCCSFWWVVTVPPRPREQSKQPSPPSLAPAPPNHRCNCCVLAQMYRHVKPTEGCCDPCDCAMLLEAPDDAVCAQVV